MPRPTLQRQPRPQAWPQQLPPLILASTSPRRSELLAELALPFTLASPDVLELEAGAGGRTALELAEENARLKASAVNGGLVIGADTVVTIDGDALGKPADLAAAGAMLRRLSGRVHEVVTGVALSWQPGGWLDLFHVRSEVEFLPLTDRIIEDYLRRIDPLDKAGGYAIQDHGEMIIRNLTGSCSNVIGLPMEALAERLKGLGYQPADAVEPARTTGLRTAAR